MRISDDLTKNKRTPAQNSAHRVISLITLAYILARIHSVYTHTVLTTAHTTRQRAEEGNKKVRARTRSSTYTMRCCTHSCTGARQ